MPQNVFESQVIELTAEIPANTCVCFDPENVRLEGAYKDQLSAYRAKRVWIEALERCFLLDLTHDFNVTVTSKVSEGKFTLRCDFFTACARYAFWRLTNHQAPEAQYMIETGHIPRGESRHEDFLEAPDLRPIADDGPLVMGSEEAQQGNLGKSVKYWLDRIMQKLS
jgi:hypothetical protein